MIQWFKGISPHQKRITLPTLLTLARVVSIPFLTFAILQGQWVMALWLLSFAAITDVLDGWLARLWREQTVLGALLDPAADKLLTITGFAASSYVGLVPVWFFGVSCVKELLLTLSASGWYAVRGGAAIHANWLGKIAMVGQTGLLAWCLLGSWLQVLPTRIELPLFVMVAGLMIASLLLYSYQAVWGKRK